MTSIQEKNIASSTVNKIQDRAMSLEKKISELITAQSKFQSKLQADCAINSTRILEMTRIQEKNITSSTVNASSLLEIRKCFNESLDTLTSCIETFKISQAELSLEMKSSSENIKSLTEKQTELSLLVASMAELAITDQSGETHPPMRDPESGRQITGNSSKPGPSVTSTAKSTISDQSVETHLHTGNLDTGCRVTKAPNKSTEQSVATPPSDKPSAQKLYNPPPTGHWELANPHAEIYKGLYDGVKFKHELDARARDLGGATEVSKVHEGAAFDESSPSIVLTISMKEEEICGDKTRDMKAQSGVSQSRKRGFKLRRKSRIRKSLNKTLPTSSPHPPMQGGTSTGDYNSLLWGLIIMCAALNPGIPTSGLTYQRGHQNQSTPTSGLTYQKGHQSQSIPTSGPTRGVIKTRASPHPDLPTRRSKQNQKVNSHDL